MREQDIQIRNATTADATSIVALLERAFIAHRDHYTAEAYSATVPGAATVAQRLAEGPTWVAVRRTELIGTLSGQPRGEDFYLRSLAVDPGARRLGVGEMLLMHAEHYAIASRFARLRLDTTRFLTASHRLYLRLGFLIDHEDDGDLHGTSLMSFVRTLR